LLQFFPPAPEANRASPGDKMMFRPVFMTLTLIAATLTNYAAAAVTYHVGAIQEISQGCAPSAEVEQAVDRTHSKYVYEAWIGCGGIGFARSTDGGVKFSTPIAVPQSQSSFSWDPSIAVGPDGTLYVAYMSMSSTQYFPVVATSFDHGISFPQVTQLLPPDQNNWGDRVFLAVAPDGALYATWDYGPFISYIQLICSQGGSCSYSYGDLNAVVQKSTDRGKTFSSMVHVSPNFPGGGAEAAPMVVESSGQIDTYYQADLTLNQQNFQLAPGGGHITASVDGGEQWSKPIFLTSRTGKVALPVWWIDGAIGIDAGDNLYATWDIQGKNSDGTPNDIGYLAYSTDHGQHWSKPIKPIPDKLNVPHIVEVAGGAKGIAYVAWLSDSDSRGYALYLRTFSITKGWLGPPVRISKGFGNNGVWPGDTFGISTRSSNSLVVSWGSAVSPDSQSNIYAVPVKVSF
jgi:hypothetical protein